MKIAILGWGSLIWNPQNLNYNKELGWNTEGPYLPIEFSRISSNGRLTLVIEKNAEMLKTLFAISHYEKLDEALLDLAVREGCSKGKIGYCYKDKSGVICDPKDFKFQSDIEKWMVTNDDIDAVLWTNLSVKFYDTIGLKLTVENIINYLETLDENIKPLAEEYIRKAPKQIDTKMRRAIEERLKWYKIEIKLK